MTDLAIGYTMNDKLDNKDIEFNVIVNLRHNGMLKISKCIRIKIGKNNELETCKTLFNVFILVISPDCDLYR